LHIGIDLTALLPQSTGVDVSLIGLASGLARIDGDNRYTLFMNAEDRNSRFESLPTNFRILASSLRPRAARLAFQQVGLPVLTRTLGIDVLHSPSFIMPMISGRARHVLTIHDMTSFSNPEWHTALRSSRPYRRAVEMSIRKADLVLVPSAHVRQMVLGQVRDLPPDSVRVIPWGLSPDFRVCEQQETQKVLERLGLPKRFVLFVGTLEPRKNLGSLLHAFELLTDHHEVPEHLVIAGATGWGMKEIRRRIDNGGTDGRIHYLDYIPQETLPHLYASARLFVYPSFEEGFGFPPLEAMACGTPAIASTTSSLAENLGDAAILVAPDDPAALADAMHKLLSDDATHSNYRQRGLECVSRFSWPKAAQRTLECYRDVSVR